VFKVAFRIGAEKSLWGTQIVCVDSLPEAEIMALKVVDKHFQSKALLLVHKGDLVYDVFEIGALIGEVLISTA
jgi:hypothetical protein